MKYIVVTLVMVILCLGLWSWDRGRQWDRERSLYVLNDSLLQRKVLDMRDSSNRHLTEYAVMAISYGQLAASTSKDIAQLKKDLALVRGELKNVKSSTTVTAVTKDTAVFRPNTVIPTRAGESGKVVEVPIEYHPDTFIYAAGYSTFKVLDTGVLYMQTVMGMQISNSTRVTYYNKTKFLGKPQLQLLITQDNPHTTTGRVQTYYVQPDKKLFQKWWFHMAVGAAAAFTAVSFLK